MSDKATIKIPRPLYESLQEQIEGTGFSSVTEFVVYMLRNIAASGDIGDEPSLTHQEIEGVRTRLKSLGYLD